MHRVNSRLTLSLPGWADKRSAWQAPIPNTFIIGILTGEGVGPELISASGEVLKAIQRNSPYNFEIRYGDLIGNAAKKEFGKSLTPEVITWSESIFSDGGAILCGPAGSTSKATASLTRSPARHCASMIDLAWPWGAA